MILNDTEVSNMEKEQNLDINSEPYLTQMHSLLRFSLVPTCSKKFTLIDAPKDIRVDVRSLPALELLLIMPKAYPSN